MKKIFYAMFIIILALCISLTTGCDEASRVSANLSTEADNFNVVRRLTVINCIQGDVLFQMEGKISIETNTSNELEIIVEDENGNYQKHFVGLSDNVTYIVEQMNYKNVEKYKYVINFNPKMWLPVEVKTVD